VKIHSTPLRWLLAVSAAALLPACGDRTPVTPETTAPIDAPAATKLVCTVTVRASLLHCGAQTPDGARGNLVLGGQGTYVRLASSGTSWDAGTQVLRSDVTVQNLLSQRMGTVDGVTVAGVRVFFQGGPTVTLGTGTVSLANADGVGAFTAGAQPYFLYDEILDPLETAAARSWRFSVPATVEQFTFTVLVDAPLPLESGVLRWTLSHGDTTGFVNALTGVWATPDGTRIWAVGTWRATAADTVDNAQVLVSENGGRDWKRTLIPGGAGVYLTDVWGTAADDIYAVGSRHDPSTNLFAGVILHFDGASWTETPSPVPGGFRFFRAVWGAGPDAVFVVGWQFTTRMQGVMLRFDGTSWTEVLSDGGAESGLQRQLHGVWGSGPNDVWAVGSEENPMAGQTYTFALHFDGTAWTVKPAPYASPGRLYAVWAASADTLFAAGQAGTVGTSGLLLRSSDGGQSWTPTLSPATGARALHDLWGADGGAVYAVGGDGPVWDQPGNRSVILGFNGSAWTEMASGVPYELQGVFGVSRTAPIAVGGYDSVLMGTR